MARFILACGLIAGLAACDSSEPSPSATPPIQGQPQPGSQASSAPGAQPPSTPKYPPAPFPKDAPAPAPAQDKPPPSREEMFPRLQEFVVKPLEGEPVWPSPADEKEVARHGFIPFKGGYQYERVDASGKVGSCGVVVDGRILLDRGVVELLGCGEGGKEYESVLRLDADVQGLDLALSLCGLKRGPVPGRLGDPKIMQGDRVVVLLQWEDEEKKTITHRAEDCVVNIQKKAPMPRVGWTYVGAMLPVPDPAATTGKTYRVLAASGTRSLLTTYRDPSTLLDNPLFDAVDDSLYMANYMILPTGGTKVRIILRAPDEAAKQEIAKLEEELAK